MKATQYPKELKQTWLGMKSRCTSESNPQWPRYGGRGISVYPEWLEDRTKYFEWALANGWKSGRHAHRIDNDGNYEPGNIKYLTKSNHAKLKRTPEARENFRKTLAENTKLRKEGRMEPPRLKGCSLRMTRDEWDEVLKQASRTPFKVGAFARMCLIQYAEQLADTYSIDNLKKQR